MYYVILPKKSIKRGSMMKMTYPLSQTIFQRLLYFTSTIRSRLYVPLGVELRSPLLKFIVPWH